MKKQTEASILNNILEIKRVAAARGIWIVSVYIPELDYKTKVGGVECLSDTEYYKITKKS